MLAGWLVAATAAEHSPSVIQLLVANANQTQATDDSFDFGEDNTLPSEQAFVLQPPKLDGDNLVVTWQVAPQTYLYKDKFSTQAHDPKNVTVGTAQLPNGEVKQDEFFGRIEAIRDPAVIRIPLQRSDANQDSQFLLLLGWQGCMENVVCYPAELKAFKVKLPASGGVTWEETAVPDNLAAAQPANAPSTSPAPTAAPPGSGETYVAEQDRLAQELASGNKLWTILSFLGLGILLAFTPCVFPMVPILSGIIVGQKDITPRKAFFLSLTYVLAMAVTYTIAGVLAGLFGQNLQAMFQNPWVIGVFSAIFVLLALSMFGFYDLQMPNSIQTKLNEISNRQQGGNLLGVAVMGVLSALIVGPCVAAPLAGALIYIGQSGDAVLGGAALFALSIGMGLPLLLVGTSAGKWLPRAGAWMDAIKAVFGVMLLAVAIWLLERILPEAVTLLLWAALFIISAIYLGALSTLPAEAGGWQKFWKGVGVLALVYGILLLIASASGKGSLWQPLQGMGMGQGSATQATPALPFRTVKNLEELQQAIQDAKGQPVMLDFYASWCVTCKELEKYTFPDPAVQAKLRNAILLKADVTDNSKAAKAMLAHYKIPGPPALLFFDTQGQERRQYRVVGFMPAQAFAAHLEQALQ